MKDIFPTILLGIILIVILDVFGSISSRLLSFKYTYLAPFSFTIFICVAFMITKRANWQTAMIATAFLGFFDATVGWKIATFFKANVEMNYEVTFSNVITMSLISSVVGLIGVFIALKF